jgi:3-hydroxyisobutyrate dehydrogenase-like beta-hydroxyacid dehydrogenase
MERVGLIGTGIMGSPIAKNLLRAGIPLTIYARRENIKQEFKALGADIALTPAELAAKSSIIFLLVNYSKDVTELLNSPNGILSGAQPGTVIADMTTTDPEFPKITCAQLAAKGIDYLDAPISGGALGARNAQLVVMVGGKEEALKKCLPVLEPISSKVVYMGSSGSGQTVKLIHNQLSYTTFCAVCEAVILGEKLGLTADKMIDVFNHGTARSFATEVRFPKFILTNKFDMGVPFSTAYKDISLAREVREATKVSFPISSWVYKYMKYCMDRNAANEDVSIMIVKMRGILGHVESFRE